jgi:antitoxin component of RelBE/YafQ-DinJ toxin-antitoxin module
LRKKIPTITRPDPTYAAALRPEGVEDPGREDETEPSTAAATPSGLHRAQSMPRVLVTPSPALIPSDTVDSAPPPEPCKGPPSPAPRTAATRKIDIRVNALERQEEALIDCGVDPAHVIRAALRRAVRNWQLGLDFVPPSEEQRTRITEWRARTSLAVDAEALTALLRAHDPLDVLSKWALIRGQVEPRVWAEIDTILDEIAENAAVPREGRDH